MSDLQKVWTFGGMLDKVQDDTDISDTDPDEQFVTFPGFIGFFNEAIDEAEAEIHAIDEDYFLTKDYLPMVAGESEYEMPANIFADKIRGIIFDDGNERYPVKKMRRKELLMNIHRGNDPTNADGTYMHYIRNDVPGERKFVLVPAARETAVLPPLANPSTPITRWYLRNANRIPLPGDYVNPENILPAAVDDTTDIITVDPVFPYITGDKVKLSKLAAYTLPAGLVEGTEYFVIRLSDTSIKLATTAVLAKAGTAIDITDQGTGFFTLKVYATRAIILATVIDIPEFSTFIMEWVKANCLFKDGDPRLQGCIAKLEQQRKQMVDTLTAREPDDDNTMELDLSFYEEMN